MGSRVLARISKLPVQSSDDSKMTRPTRSVHAGREPGSDPALREKKEYSSMEVPLVGDNCRYGL